MCTLDFSTKKFLPAKPDGVAFEIDFNRIEVDGKAPDALEIELGRFAGQAVREITEICRTGKLPDIKSFSYIYNLITLFAVRNPAVRNAALSLQRHLSRAIMDLVTSSEDTRRTSSSRRKAAWSARPPQSPTSRCAISSYVTNANLYTHTAAYPHRVQDFP